MDSIFDTKLKMVHKDYANAKQTQFTNPQACARTIRSALETAVKTFWIKTEGDVPVDNSFLELLNNTKFCSKFSTLRMGDMHNIRKVCNEAVHNEVELTIDDAQELFGKLEKCLIDIGRVISVELVPTHNTATFSNPTIYPQPQTAQKVEADDFPTEPNYIIIKTKNDRVASCNGSLYDATRHCWRVKYETVMKYKYVLAVIEGIVQEVYQVQYWQFAEKWSNDTDKAKGRLEFVGEIAPESIREQFIGKTIPYEYRKPGLASPVVFSH